MNGNNNANNGIGGHSRSLQHDQYTAVLRDHLIHSRNNLQLQMDHERSLLMLEKYQNMASDPAAQAAEEEARRRILNMPIHSIQFNKNQDMLTQLPEELFQMLLKYMSFEMVSIMRGVSKLINHYCMDRLNTGYSKIGKMIEENKAEVKRALPRRESARRSHPLCSLCDQWCALETRFSLLGMTYNKYIEVGLVCFIPGKVLDEYRIICLALLEAKAENRQITDTNRLFKDMRDFSSMAMEHFDEVIQPTLPSPFTSDFQNRKRANREKIQYLEQLPNPPVIRNMNMIYRPRNRIKELETQMSSLKKLSDLQTGILLEQGRKLKELSYSYGMMTVISAKMMKFLLETTPNTEAKTELETEYKSLILEMAKKTYEISTPPELRVNFTLPPRPEKEVKAAKSESVDVDIQEVQIVDVKPGEDLPCCSKSLEMPKPVPEARLTRHMKRKRTAVAEEDGPSTSAATIEKKKRAE